MTVNDVTEWLGFACLVAFGFFIWPPAALLVAGLVLVAVANMRELREIEGPRDDGTS